MAAYALEKGGLAEVTAVLRSNYAAVVENGFDIDSVLYGSIKSWRPTHIVNAVPKVSEDGTAPFDYIVNGINIEKPLVARFPTNPLISSVAYTGATETSPGKIFNDDPDKQKIGAFSSPGVPMAIAEEAARTYVNLYNPDHSLDVIYEPNVAANRWRKLAYNSSFNPIASILRMDTPRMRMSVHIVEDLIVPIIGEIRKVAEAAGVTLQEDLVDAVIHQDPTDSGFKPSMCQDCEKGNFMEIENIIGEPLREGERLGVELPVLKVVYGIMKGLQLKVKEEKGLWQPEFKPGNPYQ
ncbi:ketopantoate reductase PanE/ApbA C terminal-domain-containing protein [Microdochium trichocladiopsis]|uniref:Ketopantoate reductase PanE/ApbA C terminal-domain-containing protein n=1 Tax=Microdochium trichocladiopsis TaxID=1682393 RepID=A0A9P9BSK1_9PEZI|nr:ketopantoate reductase PanE/ApbA C terminal-domain-containing protein [Microdochium trichocladiopsis]KAH7034532.1 ketopantoate reductase PanE/ApbA C terminal-domain-containing protein [Microdochium trichocladiopsis]